VPILSVDLAYRHHRDIGVVLLRDDTRSLEARLLPVRLQGDPQPDKLAEYFANLARDLHASVLLVDGPQGWKDPENGLEHSRVCEKQLNTPAKTGLPGAVKPANYGPFVEFSIAFFDQLSARGWPCYRAEGTASGTAIETFPLAAWRSLGLKALPAKAKSSPAVLRQAADALLTLYPTRLDAEPNHDELQALVAAFAGLAIVRGAATEFQLSGRAPFVLGGTYREGFIACPRRGTPQ
jgi:hypothetical protein